MTTYIQIDSFHRRYFKPAKYERSPRLIYQLRAVTLQEAHPSGEAVHCSCYNKLRAGASDFVSIICFEEYYLLGYNAVQSFESQPTFRMNI
jgi:hypothetical protein